jgi:hypothetical protein
MGKIQSKSISTKNKTGLTKNGYDKFKEYNGKFYTGMKIGRLHRWHYDKGEWKEKKVTPDKWEFTFNVMKRRIAHAPEGSGVPVGTGYHWFIFAHQFAEKVNANDYLTQMVGLKFKLAHKRVGKKTWNASQKKQAQELIDIMEDLIAQLRKEPEESVSLPIEFEYKNKPYKGECIPVLSMCSDGVCHELDVTLNKKHLGIIRNSEKGWKINELKGETGLVKEIGKQIEELYMK